MNRTQAVVATVLAGSLATSAQAIVTIEFIGDNCYATSISADGTYVAGNTQGDYETFLWSAGTGVVPLGRATLPVLGVGAGTPDISDDGTRVSATILGADSTYATQGLWELLLWTETMPPVPPTGGLLDSSYGSAWGISGDGETLVGLYWRPGQSDGVAHPCSWTPTGGIVDLGTAGGSGRANDANHDGSVIVGWEENPSFGNWWPTVWVNGVRENLGTEDWFYEATTVNPAGTIIGGHAPNLVNGLLVGALWRWNGTSWDEQLLGSLPGHHQQFGLTTVNDMTPDGSLVVGYDRRSSPADATGFLWTEATGIMNVTTFLNRNGVTLPPGFVIRTLSAVSHDGLTIAGSGEETFPPFRARSFLLHLTSPVGVPVVDVPIASRVRVFPNPTRGAASLSLALPDAGSVSIGVFDAAGRLVRSVRRGAAMPAGDQTVSWDGRDGAGNAVRPGVYYVRVDAPGVRESRRVVVIR